MRKLLLLVEHKWIFVAVNKLSLEFPFRDVLLPRLVPGRAIVNQHFFILLNISCCNNLEQKAGTI